MNWIGNVTPGFGNTGIMWGSQEYEVLKGMANDLSKSFLTGEGIVTSGTDTSNVGKPLRIQFLHGVLEQVSFEQDDALAMKIIPKEKVYSNTFEWSTLQQYGGAGDGFVAETGESTSQSSALFFGVSGTDDSFYRNVLQLKYLAAVRNVSLAAQLVNNIGGNAMQTVEKAATLEIVGKANQALYFGDPLLHQNQFSGLIAQMLSWVKNVSAADYGILFDAGGQPLDQTMLAQIQALNRKKYGKGTLLLQSIDGRTDTQTLLYPFLRDRLGSNLTMGADVTKYNGSFGTIKLEADPLLRLNRPVVAEGTGIEGKPFTTAQSGAPTWNNSPWSACSAGSAGTAAFYNNVSTNAGNPAAAPATPSGGNLGGNNANRLSAGTYHYAVAPVYKGREGLAWINNATAANGFASLDAVTVTAGQIVTITIDNTKVNIDGTQISGNQWKDLKYRIYRCNGTPTTMNDFDFLFEMGAAAVDGTSTSYDNGMYMPGTDNAFLITESKNGAKGWFMAQLLPLMKRELPHFMLGDPLALLLFAAPILLVPRHHVWIRNIGRA